MHLIEAIIHKDIAAARQLLKNGADSNVALDQANVTALHFAAQSNQVDMIKLLLEYGANVNATTEPDQQTALDIAKIHKHTEVITLLEAESASSTVIH